MQLIPNGPDIPDRLLQEHEDGNVVFFCGAGISYPAGLPSFGRLVDAVYRELYTEPDRLEEDARRKEQYDLALDLLERRHVGHRSTVRSTLYKILKPDYRRKGALDTHRALLELSRNRDGVMRLVTTNFDDVFERASKTAKIAHRSFLAPLLPIPKHSRWNGLVYLHGKLPDANEESGLNNMVLTSGDFGLAYLIERWAARFISELFRNHIVCFVGYSINDSVLRYMMDALAADRMLGEQTPQAYAFGSFATDNEQTQRADWEAKGVTPILYRVPENDDRHSALHSTIVKWSESYRSRTLSKEMIVVELALTKPSRSTEQDNFVGRMLWAISDESGLPAQRFANFNPAPPLEWLDEFSKLVISAADSIQGDLYSTSDMLSSLKYSLVRRPAPRSISAPMSLTLSGSNVVEWDKVMFHIAKWLTRHLNNPELIFWVSRNGGTLDPRFSQLIKGSLANAEALYNGGATEDQDNIRKYSPDSIPDSFMRALWRIVIEGRMGRWVWPQDLHFWLQRIEVEGVSASARFELRQLLKPIVKVIKPIAWSGLPPVDADKGANRKHAFYVEYSLSIDGINELLMANDSEWKRGALTQLLPEFQQLLIDALDLMAELQDADKFYDHSHYDMPSIGHHKQNHRSQDWVLLIELLRDAWLAVLGDNRSRATQIACSWYQIEYPTFKRLAFYAASFDGCIESGSWLDWLLGDDLYWLWSTSVKREVLRLVVLRGKTLGQKQLGRLEKAILVGPPRTMYVSDLSNEEWESVRNHAVWLYLSKLKSAGCILSKASHNMIDSLTMSNPSWKLAEDESDEFFSYTSSTLFADDNDVSIGENLPSLPADLVKWIIEHSANPNRSIEAGWKTSCRADAHLCAEALINAASQLEWPIVFWNSALHAWSNMEFVVEALNCLCSSILLMPDDVFLKIDHALASSLEVASKSFDKKLSLNQDSSLFALSERLISVHRNSNVEVDTIKSPNDFVMVAINHPVGVTTKALINMLFTYDLSDNMTLPPEYKSLLTIICTEHTDGFRLGRVILASQLVVLYRVDPLWTKENLLGFFNWGDSLVEARAVWQGFLWNPRLHEPLLAEMKNDLLYTKAHYSDLARYGKRYAGFLTVAALKPVTTYSLEDFKSVFVSLSQEALEESAHSLIEILESAGDGRVDYWVNHTKPFLIQVWPNLANRKSTSIAESFSLLCIVASEAFGDAVELLEFWFQPIVRPEIVVGRLERSGLCAKYPRYALKLLDAVIGTPQWPIYKLSSCLEAIAVADKKLTKQKQFQRLKLFT